MALIEVLLNLGEGQGIDYRRLAKAGGGTGGGQGALTWEHVHRAMQVGKTEEEFEFLLRPTEQVIMYLRYNQARVNGNFLAALTSALWQKLEASEARDRPRPPIAPTPAERHLMERAFANRDIRQARTVKTCLEEYIADKRCENCETSGDNYPGKVAEMVPGQGLIWAACPKCQGRQWIPWSDNQRAKGCGGDRNLWKSRYERNYLDLLDHCTKIYLSGEAKFKERLFGPAPMETKMQARA